jgi:hypothetical protein
MMMIERHNPQEIALGMLGEGSRLLDVARRVSGVGPVVGGIAGRLPAELRADLNRLVEAVEGETENDSPGGPGQE